MPSPKNLNRYNYGYKCYPHPQFSGSLYLITASPPKIPLPAWIACSMIFLLLHK